MATYSVSVNNAVTYRLYETMRAQTCSVSVYSGVTQPTAAEIAADWASYRSTTANFLVHYANQVSWSVNSLTYYFTNTSNTISANPLRAGTATWAIIWFGNVTDVQAAATSLPMSNFIVVPVSDTSGTGVIRYTDTALVTGGPAQPYDGGVTVVLSV